MSGGSYDYLCHQDGDTLQYKDEMVTKMTDRLVELGEPELAGATRTAQHLARLLYDGDASPFTELLGVLRQAWKAVEWYDSADWGVDRLADELASARRQLAALPLPCADTVRYVIEQRFGDTWLQVPRCRPYFGRGAAQAAIERCVRTFCVPREHFRIVTLLAVAVEDY